MDGSGTLLRGTSSIGSGLMRGLSTECGTPVIQDVPEEETVRGQTVRHAPVATPLFDRGPSVHTIYVSWFMLKQSEHVVNAHPTPCTQRTDRGHDGS